MNNDKVGFGKLLAWSTRTISSGIQAVLLSFLIIYCTNALGMDPILVGTILMFSKLLDGVTDLFAGYIVDKTKTRFGKGRPYEFAILGLWLTTWLLFSVPENASNLLKGVWIFVTYSAAQSIFTTLLNANQNVYMVRSFRSEKQYVTLNSIGGLITTFGVIIFNVIFPIFEAKIIYSASGWSQLIGFIAIPLTILGMMRFLFVKEKVVHEEVAKEIIVFKDMLDVLKHNKYIYIVAMITLLGATQASMGISNYYFLYIVGNVEISGVMSLFGVVAMLTLAFYPLIMKKLSAARLIQLGYLFVIPGGIIGFFAKGNLPALAIGGIFMGIAMLPVSFMNNLLIIECATYNEWKGRHRMEGTLTSFVGFANKVGSAFGSYLLGVLLAFSHFNGTQKIQSDSALLMIRSIYALYPLVIGLLIIFILWFYKLDKLAPEMEKDIVEAQLNNR